MDPAGLHLETRTLGALPIINHFLERTEIPTLLQQLDEGATNHNGPTPSQCAGLMLRNLILERGPVYSMGDWGAPFQTNLLGLATDDVDHLNDDRMGRALDRLFDADRATMQTGLVVRVIREFNLDMSQFHNDSTTITLHGDYTEADGGLKRGKTTTKVTWGHNKDHRPDLKQLLWCLSVTRDGAVPIHYKLYDGNQNDSPTHWETWEALRELCGSSDFLYVADSKGSKSTFLQHVNDNGGRFVIVLPRTRSEDATFRDHVQTNPIDWQVVLPAEKPKGDVWEAVEAPTPSAEGFRIVWVRSQHLAGNHGRGRHERVSKAVSHLIDLDKRLQNPRTKLDTREKVVGAADRCLGGAKRWVTYEIKEETTSTFKQAGRGRPGKHTKYKRESKSRFRVQAHVDKNLMEYDAKTDGAFPLITNAPVESMSSKEVLMAYKYQPFLEKRHEQLKNDYSVAPVYLKLITRIEALLFLYFVAMVVQALIERELRKAMVREEIEALPLYPEGRLCRAPTTEKTLAVFEHVQVHRLAQAGAPVKEFWPDLSPLQQELLGLLGVDPVAYGSGS